jgi:3-hydroxybutyryl-CoA dehydratase
VLSIVSGLAVQTGVMDRTVLAFREIAEWKFSRPVFFGDTVRCEMEVLSTKPFPRLGGGAVELALTVKNQKDESVMSGKWVVLIQSKPAG